MVRVPQEKKSKKSTETVKSRKGKTKTTGDKSKGAAAGKARSLAPDRPYLTPTTVAHHDDLSPEQQEAHKSSFGSQDIAIENPEDAPGGDQRGSPSPERARAALRAEVEGTRESRKAAAKEKKEEPEDMELAATEANLDAAEEEADQSKKRTEKVRKSGEQPNDPSEEV